MNLSKATIKKYWGFLIVPIYTRYKQVATQIKCLCYLNLQFCSYLIISGRLIVDRQIISSS